MESVNSTPPRSPVLYQQGNVSIQVATSPHPESVDLLKQTIYGTEGIRYRQTGQAQRIQQLGDPLFFNLTEQKTLLGMYCLDRRLVGFQTGVVPGYYGRYLAVRTDHQGRGFGNLLKATAVNYVDQTRAAPYLFYSYIEARNTRSMAASYNEGFQSVARLGTYMFRRFSPRYDQRVRSLSPAETEQARKFVADQYTGYGFQHFVHINQHQPYFMLEEAGRPVAGVQVSPIQWQFVHIPGRMGPFMQRVAPHLPGLRRFFNPARQSFLALEGVCVAPDRADLLATLLESVLAHYGIHTAMWQLDERDPLRTMLMSTSMGLLSGFQPDVTTHVMVKPVGLSTSVSLYDQPVYVSSFDYS